MTTGTIIITTAAVTLIIIVMAQLAYFDAKRRLKSRKRKLKKRFGTQSHRVFHRAA